MAPLTSKEPSNKEQELRQTIQNATQVDDAENPAAPSVYANMNTAHRWPALLRGQIITTTTSKYFNYVQLADQKAQALIILNSILIPVAINWINKDLFHVSATICIITAIFSIMSAIICIYPKRRSGRKPDGSINLLHFGDVGQLSEEEFLDDFMPIFDNPKELAKAAVRDLHDTARRIIRPKFYWLKISYLTFFSGNLIAIIWTLYNMYGT